MVQNADVKQKVHFIVFTCTYLYAIKFCEVFNKYDMKYLPSCCQNKYLFHQRLQRSMITRHDVLTTGGLHLLWFVKMSPQWTKISPHSINIVHILTGVIPLCSVYQAPPKEHNFTLLAWFWDKLGFLRHVIDSWDGLHCRQIRPAQE